MALLDVKELSVHFGDEKAPFKAVDRISYQVNQGEVLGIVGESGSGKSVSSLAVMGLIDFPGRVSAKGLEFEGKDLLSLPAKEKRELVGADIAMIFQDPMTSLNPAYESRIDVYPHQLSGGMSQRVMIAMAIACKPRLLIADEPTTALDVTIQAQIVDLLLELQQKECMSLILITHDLALVAEAAHRIIVMYAGQVVEEGRAEDIFREPKHPYTQALLRSLPEFAEGKSRLQSLPGVVPGKYDRPQGCLLNPRCPYATDLCRSVEPELRQIGNRQVKCHTPLNAQGEPSNV